MPKAKKIQLNPDDKIGSEILTKYNAMVDWATEAEKGNMTPGEVFKKLNNPIEIDFPVTSGTDKALFKQITVDPEEEKKIYSAFFHPLKTGKIKIKVNFVEKRIQAASVPRSALAIPSTPDVRVGDRGFFLYRKNNTNYQSIFPSDVTDLHQDLSKIHNQYLLKQNEALKRLAADPNNDAHIVPEHFFEFWGVKKGDEMSQQDFRNWATTYNKSIDEYARVLKYITSGKQISGKEANELYEQLNAVPIADEEVLRDRVHGSVFIGIGRRANNARAARLNVKNELIKIINLDKEKLDPIVYSNRARIENIEKELVGLASTKANFDQFTVTNMTELDTIRRDLQELDAQNVTRQLKDEDKLRNLENSIQEAGKKLSSFAQENEKNLNNQINTIKNEQLKKGAELENQLKKLENKIQQESFLGNVDITDLSKIRNLDSFKGIFVAPDFLLNAARGIPNLEIGAQLGYNPRTYAGQVNILLQNFLTSMSRLTGKDFARDGRPYRGGVESDLDLPGARNMARELWDIPEKIMDLLGNVNAYEELHKSTTVKEWTKKVQSWVLDIRKTTDDMDFEDFFNVVYPQSEDSSKDIRPEKTLVNSIVNTQWQIDELTNKLYQLEYDEDMARRGRELELASFKREIDETNDKFGVHVADEIKGLKVGLDKVNKGYHQLYDVHSVRASRRPVGRSGARAKGARVYDVAKGFLNNYLSTVFGRYV